ncbi:MAG: AMP-binding protein [Rhodobacteraceae bacterium]|nr:AMP-binding protein [Paracoccaceae bacterium]
MTQITGVLGTDPRTIAGRSIPQLLLERASSFPDDTFLQKKHFGLWKPFTWSQTLNMISRYTYGLTALGVEPGDCVALISENIVEGFVAEYAILCRGALCAAMYPDMSVSEMEHILRDSAARVVFAEDQEQVDKALTLIDKVETLEWIVYFDDRGMWGYDHPQVLSVEEMERRGEGFHTKFPEQFEQVVGSVGLRDVAIISYTSGTTGLPKGARLSHEFLLDSGYRLMDAFNVKHGHEYLSYISQAWAAEQICGIALGVLAPMVVSFAEKPETVPNDLRELAPEFLLFTPRQWEMMASGLQANMFDAHPLVRRLYEWALATGKKHRDARGLSSKLRMAMADLLVLAGVRDNLGLKRANAPLSAGSGLSEEIFTYFHAIGIPLRNLYGATESGLVAAHWKGTFNARTMGQLLPVDPTIGTLLVADVSDTGELLLSGGARFSGYHNNPDASAESFNEAGQFRTGDAIRITEDGDMIFLDRVKDLRTLANGHVYPPQFLENNLRSSPFIKDAVIIGDENYDRVSVLINIDAEICGRFAERNGLGFGTFAELSQLPEVIEQIAKTIAEVNQMLDAPSRVASFCCLPKELDPDDAELTRSRKLRRNVIFDRYATAIEALYGDDDECDLEVVIKYQDGRESVVRSVVTIKRMENADD